MVRSRKQVADENHCGGEGRLAMSTAGQSAVIRSRFTATQLAPEYKK
jgi:hypothetical protein